MSKLEILAEYGYRKNPFRGLHLQTSDSMKIKRIMKMAVESRAVVSIVAERGCGKTEALSNGLKDIDAKAIYIDALDKERITIGNIERRLISELSSEEVKRDRDIRAMQLKRILGEAGRTEEIVLILEEAHRMHHQTLWSLKGLMNLEWMGVSPLITIVLVGQYEPFTRRIHDDIRLRADTIIMKGLTASEVKDYIRATVGKHFEDDAIEGISRLKEARNYIVLQERLIELMGKAMAVGQKKVTTIEVFELFGGGMKKVIERTGFSQGDIEKITGISRSTINQVANDKQGTLTDEKFAEVRQAIAEALREKVA